MMVRLWDYQLMPDRILAGQEGCPMESSRT